MIIPFIARRYVFHKNRSTAVNIISAVTALSIVVASMAMFVVLSVFSGLRTFSLSFVNDFDPDIKISPAQGKVIDLRTWRQQTTASWTDIQAYSAVIEERVLFTFDQKEVVAWLKGVDATYTRVNGIQNRMYAGQWAQAHTDQCVVGYGIAHKLSLGLLDVQRLFEVYVPKAGEGYIENPNEAFNTAVLQPVGVYAINEETDSKYVFCSLDRARELMGYSPNLCSHIELKLSAEASPDAVAEQLRKSYPQWEIRTRQQQNETLNRMLNTENLAVYLIFTLVIIIALFNLIGALLMVIIEKKTHIKTLWALGLLPQALRRIFWLQGVFISLISAAVGLLLGSLLVAAQAQWGWVRITESLAYPVEWQWSNAGIVLLTIVLLGALSSAIASSRIQSTLDSRE